LFISEVSWKGRTLHDYKVSFIFYAPEIASRLFMRIGAASICGNLYATRYAHKIFGDITTLKAMRSNCVLFYWCLLPFFFLPT
jgi:hypothetical protein